VIKKELFPDTYFLTVHWDRRYSPLLIETLLKASQAHPQTAVGLQGYIWENNRVKKIRANNLQNESVPAVWLDGDAGIMYDTNCFPWNVEEDIKNLKQKHPELFQGSYEWVWSKYLQSHNMETRVIRAKNVRLARVARFKHAHPDPNLQKKTASAEIVQVLRPSSGWKWAVFFTGIAMWALVLLHYTTYKPL